ncbi:arsenite methyltransferase [Bacteroidota bacterium]
MKDKLDTEKIKNAVKSTYGKLVSSPAAASCCGPQTSCCSSPSETMKGNLVKLAGYKNEKLEQIPTEAVENSFGCGDPLAFAEVKEGETVVDIGSGAGIDCFIASEKVGPDGKVIGIDMTPEMIGKAGKNAESGGYKNVEFRLGDAENMPVEDSSADWVISNCVINLSPDKPIVFSEIARVLKPGGKISISDIVLGDDLPDIITENIPAWTGCIAGAVKESDYIEGLKNAGLSSVFIDSRIKYDSATIKHFINHNDLPISKEDFEILLNEVEGKFWSAKIKGEK